jgi:hypothetical protein
MNNVYWAVMGEVAFLMWIFTVIGFLLHSFPSVGTIKRRTALYWGSGAIISYGIWITGMIKA